MATKVQVGEERSLPSVPASVPAARAFVAEHLARWGLDEWVEAATLCASELVTNAVLHAGTDATLVVRPAGPGVRLEVRDTSSTPVQRPAALDRRFLGPGADPLDAVPTTGRGLDVVAAVADAWGVQVDPGGKTVWAELGTGRTDGSGWPDPPATGALTGESRRPVRLVAVPFRLAWQHVDHLRTLVRELALMPAVPPDLAVLARDVGDRYATTRPALGHALALAAGADRRLVDVDLAVSDDESHAMWAMLGALDGLTKADHLLAPPPGEEVAAFRHWCAGEVERQVHGAAPQPCPLPVLPLPPAVPAEDRPVPGSARLSSLLAVTGGLTDARDSRQVADVLFDRGLPQVGASTGSLCLLADDGETVEIVHQTGYDDDVVGHWQTFPLSADLPASEAIRTGQPVFLATVAERDARYPVFARTPTVDDPSVICLPMRARSGRTVGTLAVGFAAPRRVDDEERAYLMTLAGLAAQALERVRLQEAEAAAADRAAFMAGAVGVLNRSLDVDQTLRTLAGLVVPRLGDWCSVFVLSNARQAQLVTVAHVDPAAADLVRTLHTRWPPGPDAPSVVWRCLQTGEPSRLPTAPPEALDHAARDPELRDLLQRLRMGHAVVAPIAAGDRVYGALVLANRVGRPLSDTDYALAVDLAARAGAAAANAALYRSRSEVAEALQHSLLPPALPQVPGVDLAARYRSSMPGLDVGGDFYDAFATDGGWLLAIGDVRGKGVQAAALTGMARHTIRALSLVEDSPRRLLEHVNRLLLAASPELDEPRFVTVALARVRSCPAGLEFRLCLAGHMQPLVRRADGRVEEVGTPGDLVGVRPDIELHEVDVELVPGDVLVAFTDGVTDVRRGRDGFGEAGLRRTLAALPDVSSAAVVADGLEQAALAFGERPPPDDIALLVVRVEG